ncbi:MAG TPA: hypothetical protein RMF84_20715 [Polyangiaceae bacterium LLY-WYZ-14_1]|nr:hypothetical protein [Polyangiaceae bacterium LLY-WYZ-14_1]
MNLRAVAQAAYQASEQLSFSFGAVLSYDFGQLLPLPHLDLDWQPTRRDRHDPEESTMNTLRIHTSTIVLALLTVGTAACGDGGGAGDGLARPADYIRGSRATRLVIELDTVEGKAPRAGVADALTAGLAPLLDKPDGVVVEVDQTDLPAEGEDRVWTFSALQDLADRTFDVPRPEGTIALHTLWLDGRFESGGVLGVAWANRHVAIFSDFLDRSCFRLLPGIQEAVCVAAEEAIWTHEVGHVLGLVNNGIPMVEDHQDEENGAHDDSQDCVMYWAYENASLVDLIRDDVMSGNETDLGFDDACLADLAAVRDGARL